MTDELYKYCGKPLSSLSLWDLQGIKTSLEAAEARRGEASKHEKFTRTDGKAMQFPPPNPNFLILKSKIEEEIRKKKENDSKSG